MRLVLLDRLNAPADFDFSSLETFGEVVSYESTAPLESFSRVAGFDVVISAAVPISRALLDWAPRIRQVLLLSASADRVDLQAARDLGVIVTVLGEPPGLGERAAKAITGRAG